MLKIEINKRAVANISAKWLEQVAAAFCKAKKLKGEWHFSLAFVGQSESRRLNRNYRGKNQPTDVLSFTEEGNGFIDGSKEKKYLGEIVICAPIAKRQAKELGHSFKEEVARLLIHGLAHLAGYEHEGVGWKRVEEMETFEGRVIGGVIN